MGRARGGPLPASSAGMGIPAPARRGASAPSPAELLGIPANPGYDGPAPSGDPIFNVRGVALFRADSTDATLSVPALTVAGAPAYPQTPREGRARLDGELWQRMVRAGGVYRIETMRELLWRAGVGTRALGGKGKDGPIGEARLREEFHAMAHEAKLPAGSDVPLPGSDSERGFGMLRDRPACRDHARHLRSRTRSELASLRALAQRAPLWFAASESARSAWTVPGAAPEHVAPLLRALSDGAWHKNRALAEAAWGEELRAAGLSADELDRALRAKARSVRKLAAQMRSTGIPVVGNPARGYRLAEHVGELQTYFEAERVRVDVVEAHAQQVEKAGALWYPDPANAEEVARARAWRSGVRRGKTAPQTLKREAQRRARTESGEKERQAVRAQAAQREAELMAMPEWAQLRHKRAAGLPDHALTERERAVARELQQQRKTKKTGRVPGAANKSGPAPARGRAPTLEPPPW